MASHFTIASSVTTVRMSNDTKMRSAITFTVKNVAGQPLRAHAGIWVEQPAQESWFEITGEATRDYLAEGVEQRLVRIEVPVGTAEGTYSFRLRICVDDEGREVSIDSPAVALEVAASTAPTVPWYLPWMHRADAIVHTLRRRKAAGSGLTAVPPVSARRFPWRFMAAALVGVLFIGGLIYVVWWFLLYPLPQITLDDDAKVLKVTTRGLTEIEPQLVLVESGDKAKWVRLKKSEREATHASDYFEYVFNSPPLVPIRVTVIDSKGRLTTKKFPPDDFSFSQIPEKCTLHVHNVLGDVPKEVPIEFVRIPENERNKRPFYLGTGAVTKEQWEAVMGNELCKTEAKLVENVSWDCVQTFIRKLNEKASGAPYRLPTAAKSAYAKQVNESWKKRPEGPALKYDEGAWEWVQDWYKKVPAKSATELKSRFRVLREVPALGYVSQQISQIVSMAKLTGNALPDANEWMCP